MLNYVDDNQSPPVMVEKVFLDYVRSVLGRKNFSDEEALEVGKGYFPAGCWINWYEDMIDQDESDFTAVYCQSDYDELNLVGKAGYCSFYCVDGYKA